MRQRRHENVDSIDKNELDLLHRHTRVLKNLDRKAELQGAARLRISTSALASRCVLFTLASDCEVQRCLPRIDHTVYVAPSP